MLLTYVEYLDLGNRVATEEYLHALHNSVLGWVVRMINARDFQYRRYSLTRLTILFYNVSDIITYVLVNQDDSYIFP